MTRDAVPLSIPDLAAFATRLRAELAPWSGDGGPPGHLRLLGHLARAGGFRNWQHLRASVGSTPATTAEPSAPVDVHSDVHTRDERLAKERAARALRAFDVEGRMARWPNRTSVQALCLWVLWARLPSRRDLGEPEVDAVLKAGHGFGDHVLLRRSLVGQGLVSRSPDGRRYRRVEQPPPPEARSLIAQVLHGTNAGQGAGAAVRA